jgi:hypothetical protein
MVIHISWEWRTEYEPARWSFGYCPSCQQEGPLTLDDVYEVCYLWSLFQIDERLMDERVARCDFCRHLGAAERDGKGIRLREWSPEQGTPPLLEKLAITDPLPLLEGASDARLHSLLRAVQRASSLHGVHLSPLGAIAGSIAGVLAAIPLGGWLWEQQNVRPTPDEAGFVMMLCMIGGVAGLILGATVEFLSRRGRRPLARIHAAHAMYGIDLHRLQELSGSYSRRIRKAVAEACAKASLDEALP